MPFFTLLALLLGVPLLELYLLLTVGSAIGAGATVLLVIGTAVLGAGLLRWQGMVTLTRARDALAAGELPAQEIVEGPVLLLAAVLLLTPGFATDALGFLLLLPPLRRRLAAALIQRGSFIQPGRTPDSARAAPHGARTIDGDYRIERD